MTAPDELLRLGVAALGGLAVGVEREWSARQENDRTRFGGVRTFLLLGLAGGLAALASEGLGIAVAAALLGSAGALVAIAYFVSAWRGTIDATTEVAGVVVLAGGFLAGRGALQAASAAFAATALVLVEKGRMHRAVERLKSEELQAAARFAVLALVVLPLVPAEPIALLGGIEPRRLWGLVLLFSGLSFAGYVALRAAGPERGLGLAGLLGGIVSSTAVTIQFAKESRLRPELAPALAAGALASSAIMPLRVGLVSLVLHRGVALTIAPMVAAAVALGGLFVVRALVGRTRGAVDREVESPSNPLRLAAAMQMTALFVVVLGAIEWVREALGTAGLLAGAALLGLTDLDALTLTMNRAAAGSLPIADAARALALGMLANTLFKGGMAFAFGAAPFRRAVAGGLALWLAIFAAGFVLLGR